jgi:hypothetical protein
MKESRRLRPLTYTAIVFMALSVESAVFDLAAVQLGQKFTEGSIEKLDTLAKWQIVPRLICGKGLDPNGPAINALRVLIKSRNSLVHSKSTSVPTDPNLKSPSDPVAIRTASKKYRQDIHQAFQAIVLLYLELTQLFKSPFEHFQEIEILMSKLGKSLNPAKVDVVLTRIIEINKNFAAQR